MPSQQHQQQSQFLVIDNSNTPHNLAPQQIQAAVAAQQIHTIMLNGQPALFIPASSNLSMNVIGQMQMQMQSTLSSNNSTNNTNEQQQSTSANLFDMGSSTSSSGSSINHSTDFSSLLANQLILPMLAAENNKTLNKDNRFDYLPHIYLFLIFRFYPIFLKMIEN